MYLAVTPAWAGLKSVISAQEINNNCFWYRDEDEFWIGERGSGEKNQIRREICKIVSGVNDDTTRLGLRGKVHSTVATCEL